MSLTKHDLVARVANELSMSQTDVSRVLEETLETVCRTLARGGRLEFRGFGVFEVRTRAGRGAQPQDWRGGGCP